MTQGISTLPGAQQAMQQPQAPQAPGQAAPFQAMPASQPKTPQAMTGQLQNLPPQQLLQMFANPADQTPKWAVVSAYAKAIEQQRLMQAAQGQQAMQQGQAQAQQPPVAAQVMSQPMAVPQSREQMLRQSLQQATQKGDMDTVSRLLEQIKALEAEEFQSSSREQRGLRYGGIAQFAGGGAVAFQSGGRVQKFAIGADEFGVMSDPAAYAATDALRVERANREKQIKALEDSYYYLRMENDPRAAQVKSQLDALRGGQTPSAQPVIASYPETAGRRFPSPIVRQGVVSDQAPRPSSTRRQAAAPAAAAAEPIAGIAGLPSDLTPEQRAAIAQRRAAIEARRNLPEDVVAGRAGLESLARQNLAAQEIEAQTFAREAREALEEARKRRERSPLSDVAFLGQMLEGMRGSKRFGEALAGAAAGAGKAASARDVALREAEKDFRAAQRDERAMQSNLRQARMLEAQRAQALRENDMTRVQQIDEQLATLSVEQEALRRSMAKEAADFGLRQRQTIADERRARAAEISAGKPSEIEFAAANPETYAKVLEARAKASQGRVSREAILERYADNWEKMDLMQKAELAKQGVTNFQQYVQMRDQLAASGATAGAPSMAAPAVGTVMQGYRFKGGNPADKNNWEKV